jgi:hypothetical protein
MARKKMRNLCLGTKCTTLVHQSSEATTLLHLNQTALFRGIDVVKHPFYSIRPKMMFGSVSEHFANLRHAKRCKTCDEDMTPMHTTMIGAWNGVEEVQQRSPSQEGGPRLIRFESPRWRPKAIQVRV